MRVFFVLLRRELAAYFLSLTGYVIIAAITFLTGAAFVQMISALASEASAEPMTQLFFTSFYFWMILLLATPVITMRLFALEKSSGTFETLMTAPVGDFQVVAAKFTTALLFYAVMWLPTLGLLLLVGHLTRQIGALDLGTLAGTYLGIFLAGAYFLSFGCLASAISRTQMVAAMISLAFGVTQFTLAYWVKSMPLADTWQSRLCSCMNLFDQITDFTRGTVDSRALVFYLSATFLFLFLTLRAVETRRWK
jgi:ABC-2 type transport system permease protein